MGGGWSGVGDSNYASPGAAQLAYNEYQAYAAQQQAILQAEQAYDNSLPGYQNFVTSGQAVPGLNSGSSAANPPPGYQAVLGPDTVPTPNGPGSTYGLPGDPQPAPQPSVIGYNPINGAGNVTQLQGYTGETPSGGGTAYNAPVAYNPGSNGGPNLPGYIDFGSAYNPVTNPTDYMYYGNYGEALAAGDPNGGKISYGTNENLNYINPTSSVGVVNGGWESDPTINGVDYTQGASYQNLFNEGIGQTVPQTYSSGGGSNGPGGVTSYAVANPTLIEYNQYTEPGYVPPQYSAAAPQGTQSYNAQGQAVAAPTQTSGTGGNGFSETFYYGDNGSGGSLSGTTQNLTPGQSSNFYVNEPGSLTNANPNQSTLGTFAGQPGASQAAPAATDSASGYFTYGADYSQIQSNNLNAETNADSGVNQATGAIGGYNPLGYDASYSSSFTGTDQALGYSNNPNSVAGINGAVLNQSNPSLQALSQSRQSNFPGGFS